MEHQYSDRLSKTSMEHAVIAIVKRITDVGITKSGLINMRQAAVEQLHRFDAMVQQYLRSKQTGILGLHIGENKFDWTLGGKANIEAEYAQMVAILNIYDDYFNSDATHSRKGISSNGNLMVYIPSQNRWQEVPWAKDH
jgi:hypothetical protein